MNKVLKTVLLLVVFVVLGLSTACTLKASTPPPTNATPTGELNFLTPTTVAGGVATLTAVAKPQVATATPKAAAPTAVPVNAVQPTSAPQEQSSSASIPTLERPSTYTLQKGEWPICIARRYDLDLATLFAQNGMNMNSKPATGTVLKIASSGNWNASAYGPRELRAHVDYKVGANDSVYSIACYFGDVSPEGILAANGLSNSSQVTSGMTLKIP